MIFSNKRITPSEIVKDGKKYIFAMNTKKKARLDVQKAAELNGYDIIFVDNASNMFADPLPDYCSVYILKEDYEKLGSMDRLINTITTISEKYKELLRNKGYDVDNIPLTEIYLGCERHENIPLKKNIN